MEKFSPALLCSLLVILAFSPKASAAIYKYKDDKGQWVYTDKKPSTKVDTEEVKYKAATKAASTPKSFVKKYQGNYYLIVENPYYAPIEIEVFSPDDKSFKHKKVIPAASLSTLYKSKEPIPGYKYRWVIGSPEATVTAYNYNVPGAPNNEYKITQSFNGRFSHSKQPSQYAVDIAMDVGTYIGAARDGTVIWVKDDYHMGGRDDYFKDKANYVKVLHSDGTYAVYAHILLGSALVKPGDKVAAGDRLARSGSSGYSTGPHLHFVIYKNMGLKTQSIKFSFVDAEGQGFTPVRGMKISIKK